MAAANKHFSLADQREVFFSSADISDAVRYAARTGKARRLGPRLYTKNVASAPEEVCLRNWAEIAAGYFPGAVIVGRTAMTSSRPTTGRCSWRPRARGTCSCPGCACARDTDQARWRATPGSTAMTST